MRSFEYWESKFNKQDLVDFTFDKEAVLWLKLRSISRAPLLESFLKFCPGIKASAKRVKDRWQELFELFKSDPAEGIKKIDDFSKKYHQKHIAEFNYKELSNQLYKVESFKWGGDRTNSLDKQLVSRFVKEIRSFEQLQEQETEIGMLAFDYVKCSWYNHWSSILIEQIFMSHDKVTPTLGQIKGVDFFIGNIPFDLKVTHLPKGFVEEVLKEKGYDKEVTFLKREAKRLGIDYDKNTKDEDSIRYQIYTKLKDKNAEETCAVISTVLERRQEILSYAIENKNRLARWLYENQGDMRFGAENRLFLVLVDNSEWENSWTLKRNLELLQPEIHKYLNEFKPESISDFKLSFTYKSREYTTYSDILFVVKNR